MDWNNFHGGELTQIRVSSTSSKSRFSDSNISAFSSNSESCPAPFVRKNAQCEVRWATMLPICTPHLENFSGDDEFLDSGFWVRPTVMPVPRGMITGTVLDFFLILVDLHQKGMRHNQGVRCLIIHSEFREMGEIAAVAFGLCQCVPVRVGASRIVSLLQPTR
jgi:hypothetical protein